MPNAESLEDVIARLAEPSQPGDTCGNDCNCTFISDKVLRQILDERKRLRAALTRIARSDEGRGITCAAGHTMIAQHALDTTK